MEDAGSPTCFCPSCETEIDYPIDWQGTVIECPACSESVLLPESGETSPDHITFGSLAEEVQSLDLAPLPRSSSFFYKLALLFGALMMFLLILVYVSVIAGTSYGVWLFADHFRFLFKLSGGIYGMIIKMAFYFGVILAGAVVVIFMIKPFFLRRGERQQPLSLNPASEPLLYRFISEISECVGAPEPSRIDLTCEANAAASFRRGFFSFLGSDLVLTIGLPLVAGLSAKELAGVLAHEFGHFNQGVAMRLSYIIRSINLWFTEIVYYRDAWDEWLGDSYEESENLFTTIVFGISLLALGLSRLIIKLFMFLGHAVSCALLRQMEYNADVSEIRLAGSESFETTGFKLSLMDIVTGNAYRDMHARWLSRNELPDSIPEIIDHYTAGVPEALQCEIKDALFLEPGGWFETHPSFAQRVKRARRLDEPGMIDLNWPARDLFENFPVVSKQASRIHYREDLGVPLAQVRFYSPDRE